MRACEISRARCDGISGWTFSGRRSVALSCGLSLEISALLGPARAYRWSASYRSY